MYVFHNLLEMIQAYMFFRTAENISDKMTFAFLAISFHHALSVLFFKRSDTSRNVYEAYWDYVDG
jgi:hypothetical protein